MLLRCQTSTGGSTSKIHLYRLLDVIFNIQLRDVDHPDEDLARLYANDVKDICDKLKDNGKKPGCFIAEGLQSCGGDRQI